jgi:hypothetical protein
MIQNDPEELLCRADRYRRLARLMTDAQAVKALVEMACEYDVRAEQLVRLQHKAASVRDAKRGTNSGNRVGCGQTAEADSREPAAEGRQSRFGCDTGTRSRPGGEGG